MPYATVPYLASIDPQEGETENQAKPKDKGCRIDHHSLTHSLTTHSLNILNAINLGWLDVIKYLFIGNLDLLPWHYYLKPYLDHHVARLPS
jgi:hypothetical protein